ncbi:hypothetical protein [Acinetobacter sp. Ac_5812]|uniref:hypothetical protein n=1 Tax=Acinetobacter sp. Ac_5812 TaxID=1848937 RepID=UPI0014904FBB|nr:hypothetical protein [Acinetobacter sp. Ac_5812]NNP68974.1 hypothetical protein [Acinetobacter sp. Ac_5812]
MNEIRPTLIIGDTLFGTWTQVDESGNPEIITQEMQFSSAIKLNNVKHQVQLQILDQNLYPGEIAFLVQTLGWQKGVAEMDILAVSGIYKGHSEKYCFLVVEGVTDAI